MVSIMTLVTSWSRVGSFHKASKVWRYGRVFSGESSLAIRLKALLPRSQPRSTVVKPLNGA